MFLVGSEQYGVEDRKQIRFSESWGVKNSHQFLRASWIKLKAPANMPQQRKRLKNKMTARVGEKSPPARQDTPRSEKQFWKATIVCSLWEEAHWLLACDWGLCFCLTLAVFLRGVRPLWSVVHPPSPNYRRPAISSHISQVAWFMIRHEWSSACKQ